jgi:hypothetical protein
MVTATTTEFDIRALNHLKGLIRHIKLVQDAAELLGERLIEQGEGDFAITLISNSLRHDSSKFHGIEWQYLTRIDPNDPEQKEKLFMAHKQHIDTNEHHPEYWGGIKDMPKIYVAEMVCDWYARSHEMGTGLRDWIKNEALEKYGITYQSKQYKWIKDFVDLLLDPPFKDLKNNKKKEVKSEG